MSENPMSDDELIEWERRILKLRDVIDEGKLKIGSHINTDLIESLQNVTFTNGRIDMNTVNSQVRSLALGITAISDREETKSAISLIEIQTTYFTLVEKMFGVYFETMIKRGLNPHQAGLAVKSAKSDHKKFLKSIKHFSDILYEFWKNHHEIARIHIEDTKSLKAVYSGDLFPSYTGNIASRCGIYFDTIILPDPFLRMRTLIDYWSEEDVAYYFIKHALNLLNYKDIALSDVDPPIVAIIPDRMTFDDASVKITKKLGETDAVVHASKVFGRDFHSIDEMSEWIGQLSTITDVSNAAKDQDRLLFDTYYTGTFEEKIAKGLEEGYGRLGIEGKVGDLITFHCSSRMISANDCLLRSQSFHGVPVIDAPTSWKYFQWKLEYDCDRTYGIDTRDLHVSASLQRSRSSEMSWIGRIPPDALLEIRRAGALEEIRSILRDGISNLTTFSAEEFTTSSNQIITNLQKAVGDYEAQLRKLRGKGWKFAGSNIGSWLAIGTVELTAIATGNPLYGISAFTANQLFDIPTLREVGQRFAQLKHDFESHRRSPVGLLVKSKPSDDDWLV